MCLIFLRVVESRNSFNISLAETTHPFSCPSSANSPDDFWPSQWTCSYVPRSSPKAHHHVTWAFRHALYAAICKRLSQNACLLTLMGSWRLWIFLIPLSSHELSTTLKRGRFQLAQIHGSIYIIVQMETSTTASNSVSKCLLSKYGFETILDQDMYTWMRGYEYLTSTLTSKGLQMGIKLAVPVYSWRLVGISRWENLCILELSVGSIPSKPYW